MFGHDPGSSSTRPEQDVARDDAPDDDATHDPAILHDAVPGTPPAGGPVPPATGDAAIDGAMAEFAAAQPGPFQGRIDAGERAHRLLQGRLGGLGEA